jgi:hypothetical protein
MNGWFVRGGSMRGRTITYWTTTALVAFVMAISGGLALSHSPRYITALSHLGYPAYFSTLLGLGKIAGVCVLLAPGLGRLKEWAYAAFGIVVLSACYSHLLSGDGLMALEPLATGAVLVVSYATRPASRRFAALHREATA